MNNEQDILIMESILSELDMDLNELDFKNSSSETIYDKVIKNALKTDNIPQVIGIYELGTPSPLKKEDEDTFSKLYGISPPKKNKEIGEEGSKGSGNGEISMYWLFRYQKYGHLASDTRGGSNPDLVIDGSGIDIKGQDDNALIKIGRIGSFTESLNDLNLILGIGSIQNTFEEGGKKKTPPNTFHVDKDELIEACKNAIDIYNNKNLKEVGEVFGLEFINSIYSKLDVFKEKHKDIFHDENKLAAGLFKSFISQKLEKKPGYPGYIVNVSKNGPTKYIKITDTTVDSLNDDEILKNVSLKQGFLSFKSNLF